MKLLVILLCLFSERFLIHAISYERFSWFSAYLTKIYAIVPDFRYKQSPFFQWALALLPVLLSLMLLLYLTGHWFWGLVGFIINLFVFHYCLGPENPFYPPAAELLAKGENPAAPYFANVNRQMFAPAFWYLLLGPVFLLFYRLNDLLRKYPACQPYANYTADLIEWIPARITALCYLLAGHFQKGFKPFRQYLMTGVENNSRILSDSGMAASSDGEDQTVNLPQAEGMVEQALMVFLVIFAILTIAVWY